jgi:dihydrofolate synthase/folylpolyglutamate synthase
MLSDKPVEGYAEVLAPLVKACYCGGLPAPRGLTGLQLADRARSLHGAAFPDILSAFAAARQDLQQGEVVVVCGSFLTVAEVAGR